MRQWKKVSNMHISKWSCREELSWRLYQHRMRSFSFPSLLLLSSNCCSNVLSLTSSVSTQTSQTTSLETQNQAEKMDEFGLQEPHSLTSFQEHNPDTIPDLFASESDHMPSHNSLSCSKDSDFYYAFRLEAISLFLQVKKWNRRRRREYLWALFLQLISLFLHIGLNLS